ncbi:MAG TPA: FAD-binding oxidoreductase [Solirubrobacteraceae bacterium]|nr:FAD-binding oxidoreductase [Solirubrobacteraceae bacterium]
MTALEPGPLDLSARRLASRLRGRLLVPGDRDYDTARRVFNAMIDRRPALIIQCAGTEDVIEGVIFAREHGVPLSIKGGGHSVAGTAVCDRGLLLDLAPMKAVHIDTARRIATVEPGLTLGDLDRETQRFGLAVPSGVVSMTGLAGLALGGGLGWLNGAYGLTCDNLLAADVITAAGELVTANAHQYEDLLWALRGGGGNFGVVTSFTFRLHPVDEVLAGTFMYARRKAAHALRLYREFAAECPDELGANASVFRGPDGEVAVSIAICYAGERGRGERLLDPLRTLGPAEAAIQPMAYRQLQHAADHGFPSGRQHYWKSGFVTAIDDELIEIVLDFVERMPSLHSGVGLQQLHGAAGRVRPAATAYPHRGERYDLLILSQWPDPAQSPRNVTWTRELFAAIQPHLSAGVYVNNLGADDTERLGHAYGSNYDRLVAVKTRYDPTNVFRQNHNIKPQRARPARVLHG